MREDHDIHLPTCNRFVYSDTNLVGPWAWTKSVSQLSATGGSLDVPTGIQCGQTLGDVDTYSSHLPFRFTCPQNTLGRYASLFQTTAPSMAVSEVEIFITSAGWY